MAREQLQTLTEPMYYILLSLSKPMHGYEIMQTVNDISRQRVKVGAGTLYSLLMRFEKEKIIRQISDDGRRKVYELTDKGHEILNNEYNRLKNSVSAYNEYIDKIKTSKEGSCGNANNG